MRGWVLEADTARAVDLAAWPAGAGAVRRRDGPCPPAELTGSAGGSLNWVGVYDAGTNRLAFHDPLDDLATVAPNGAEGDQAAYVVAGWWSTASLDPLDGAQTSSSLHARLDGLGWALADDLEGGDQVDAARSVQGELRASLGLQTSARYAPAQDAAARRGAGAAPAGTSLGAKEATFHPDLSVFADEAISVQPAEPAWPRSVLLHGAVYGVPLKTVPKADNRPTTAQLGVVLGEHGDDLAAGLASSGLASSDPAERRALERLLAAFTGQLLDRVGTPDGLVDIEEHEHAAGFVARPGGAGGTDRLQTGRQEAGDGAGRLARSKAARVSAGEQQTKITAFARKRSDLARASEDDQRQALIEATGGTRPETEPAAQSREVTRPAPRLIIPGEPMRRRARRRAQPAPRRRRALLARRPAAVPLALAGDARLPAARSRARTCSPRWARPRCPTRSCCSRARRSSRNPYWSPWLAGVGGGQGRPGPGRDRGPPGRRGHAALRRRRDLRRAHRGVPRRRRRAAGADAGRRAHAPGRRARRRSAAPLLAAGRHRPRPGRRDRVVAAMGAAVAGVGGRAAPRRPPRRLGAGRRSTRSRWTAPHPRRRRARCAGAAR